MSDFVRNIVEQVLTRNDVPSATANRQRLPHVSNQKIATIERPNYQRMKQDRRLSPLKQTVSSPMNKERAHNKRSFEDKASRLQRLSLAHGRHAISSVLPERSLASLPNEEHVKEATFIGRTRDETYVWFFPQVHHQLRSNFHLADGEVSVGMITASQCYPGQLFFIEALLREHSGTRHYIEWDKTGSRSFLCELYSDDANELFRALKDIYQQLNRRALRGVDGYTSISPSAWLLQQLHVVRSVGAIGVLEGISRVNSIGLLNNYLRRNTTTGISFQIEDNYVLLFGDGKQLTETVTDLKQELNHWLRT